MVIIKRGTGKGKNQERGFLPVCLQHLDEFGMRGWATATQTRKNKIKIRVGGAWCSDVPLPKKLKTNERLRGREEQQQHQLNLLEVIVLPLCERSVSTGELGGDAVVLLPAH